MTPDHRPVVPLQPQTFRVGHEERSTVKPVSLSGNHYAAAWKTDKVQALGAITELGCRYAELPAEEPDPNDVSWREEGREQRTVHNPVKQDLLLEICQAFHPYLMKHSHSPPAHRIP